MDRTPDGYDGLKSAINDKRIIMLKGCSKLEDELTDLERDNMTHKYDHPVGGSKDEADSFAGAFLDASKYKGEYLYFKPDDYDYEGLNDDRSDEDQSKDSMIESMLGKKLSDKTLTNLFNMHDDDDILLL